MKFKKLITAKEAHSIAEKYIKEKKYPFTRFRSVEDIEKYGFERNMEILHGPRKGEFTDVYIVGYWMQWGTDERPIGVRVDANTGEILYTMGPHGCLEALD